MSLVHSTQDKYWTFSKLELDELKTKTHSAFDSRISLSKRESVLLYFEKKILEDYGRNQKFPDKVVVVFVHNHLNYSIPPSFFSKDFI
jgi:hypothetical protein